VVGVVVLFVGYVLGNGIVKIDLGGDDEDSRPPKLMDINVADIPYDEYDEDEEGQVEQPLEEDIAEVEADDFDVDAE
jgi:hypothetical protein